MFTVSLHQIKIFAPIGLYPQEKILGNRFEVDLDVDVKDYTEHHFVDYTILNDCIHLVFEAQEEVLELLAIKIYKAVKDRFSFVQRIKITVRKYNPPMRGDVGYSQVIFEK
ncbi:MAG: dihydroneopterin aldolase [Bacteroidota bacterium]